MPVEERADIKRNPSYIYYGDVVSFFIDDMGFLATSSSSEPLPESIDYVSHLRIKNAKNANDFPEDYCYR